MYILYITCIYYIYYIIIILHQVLITFVTFYNQRYDNWRPTLLSSDFRHQIAYHGTDNPNAGAKLRQHQPWYLYQTIAKNRL